MWIQQIHFQNKCNSTPIHIKGNIPMKAFWNRKFRRRNSFLSFFFTVNFDLRDNHLSSNVSVIYLYSWRAYLSPLHSICQKYKLPYWSPPLILVDAISRDVTRVTSTFNKLHWGSCFQGVWTAEFTSRVLWKKYFSSPLPPIIFMCRLMFENRRHRK